MEALKIIGACVLAAVLYGCVHNQITARLSIEFFTVVLPTLFPTRDPTLLALFWGVTGTWWIGVIVGVGLAAAARAGSWPPLGLRDLRWAGAITLVSMALGAVGGGLIGGAMGRAGAVHHLPSRWLAAIPPHRYPAFVAVLGAQQAAHVVGGLGALALVVITLVRRAFRAGRVSPDPRATEFE